MQKTMIGLDVGSDKICATLVELTSDGGFDIVNSSFVQSNGIHKGKIVDLNQAALSIKKCLDVLIDGYELTNRKISIGINCCESRIISSKGTLYIKSDYKVISPDDIKEVLNDAKKIKLSEDEIIINVIPEIFIIDENKMVDNPTAMNGKKLEVIATVVIAKKDFINNINNAVRLAGWSIYDINLNILSIRKILLGKKTSSFNTLIVDIGHESTELSFYRKNDLRYISCIQIGGDSISNDLAICLELPKDEGDRIKKLYSSTYLTNYKEEIVYALKPSENQYDAKLYKEIVEARIEEIISIINENIKSAHYLDEIDNIYVIGEGAIYFENIKYKFEDMIKKNTVIVTKNHLGLQNSCIINSIGIVKDAFDGVKLLGEEKSTRNDSSGKFDDNNKNEDVKVKKGIIHSLRNLIKEKF